MSSTNQYKRAAAVFPVTRRLRAYCICGEHRPRRPGPRDDKVALAGHSFGAVTTALASGIPWKKGSVVLDMEAAPFNFRRVDNGGTPSDISDDSGPFINAEAFLNMSETMFDGAELGSSPGVDKKTVHTLLDADRPNLTGRDMISKPFMLIAGSKDLLVNANGQFTSNIENSRLYDSVTGGFGLHDARYGVIIDEGNHITAVGEFDVPGDLSFTSWGFRLIWNRILPLVELLTPEEKAFFDGGSFEAKLEDTMTAMFSGVGSIKADEEARAAKIQEYTLAFWDAYLSPRYDVVAGKGSEFLGLPVQSHLFDPLILSDDEDIPGFVRRDPVRGFVVKDNSGTPLVQFQNDGNVLISTGVFSSSGGSNIATSTSVREFIVKAQNGTNLMKIDSAGLRIRGNLNEGRPSVSAGAGREFIIRDVRDTGSSARIILDSSGNLYLLGEIYTANP